MKDAGVAVTETRCNIQKTAGDNGILTCIPHIPTFVGMAI